MSDENKVVVNGRSFMTQGIVADYVETLEEKEKALLLKIDKMAENHLNVVDILLDKIEYLENKKSTII